MAEKTEENIKNNSIEDTKEERKWTVYIHTVPKELSGYEWDKYYVGITSQKPEKRWRDGHGYKNNKYFSRAIQKYGWENISHEIIASNLTRIEACEMEKKLIQVYKSNDYKFGYNITLGGESAKGLIPWNKGKKLSEETKKKLSNKLKGRVYSEETCKKHSENLKKRWENPEFRNRMSGENNYFFGKPGRYKDKFGFDNPTSKAVISLNTLVVYGSASEAGRTISDFNGACACCNGKQHYAGVSETGFPIIWIWYDEYKNMSSEDVIDYVVQKLSKCNIKPVINIDTNEIFPNIKSAVSFYSNSNDSSYFVKKLKKTNKLIYGFKWLYLSDYLKQNNLSYFETLNKSFFILKKGAIE